MIVVEGNDGTGKTTLVSQLAEDLTLPIGERGAEARDVIWKTTRMYTYKALSNAVEGSTPPAVWDRLGPFSDPIYSRVTSRGCQFKPEEIRFTSTILKALRCPIIVCMIPLEIAQENAETAHQMEGVIEHFAHVHGRYECLVMAMSDWPNTHTYDYRVEGAYEKLLEDVIRPYLVRRKDREWP